MNINKACQVLQVEKTSSLKEIRAAFLLLAHRFHPDKCGITEWQDRYLEVKEAYDFLIFLKKDIPGK